MVGGSGGRLPDKGPSMLGEGSGVKAKGLETWQPIRPPCWSCPDFCVRHLYPDLLPASPVPSCDELLV